MVLSVGSKVSGAGSASDDPGIGHLLSVLPIDLLPDGTKSDCGPAADTAVNFCYHVTACMTVVPVEVSGSSSIVEGAEIGV